MNTSVSISKVVRYVPLYSFREKQQGKKKQNKTLVCFLSSYLVSSIWLIHASTEALHQAKQELYFDTTKSDGVFHYTVAWFQHDTRGSWSTLQCICTFSNTDGKIVGFRPAKQSSQESNQDVNRITMLVQQNSVI